MIEFTVDGKKVVLPTININAVFDIITGLRMQDIVRDFEGELLELPFETCVLVSSASKDDPTAQCRFITVAGKRHLCAGLDLSRMANDPKFLIFPRLYVGVEVDEDNVCSHIGKTKFDFSRTAGPWSGGYRPRSPRLGC